MKKRISDEDGVQAGSRNFGRLMLALIPWALGVGAVTWLGFWVAAHDFHHQLSQEERAAAYTGANIRPQSKIAVRIVPHDCTTITRADIDGSRLVLYARNDCHTHLDYVAWHWQEVSPNGILIHQGYTNQCPEPEPNEVAECTLDYIETDDRTDTMKVWTSKTTD